MMSKIDELGKPFDSSVLGTVSKGGAKLTYVPVAEVIVRLNKVMGIDGWSETSDVWTDGQFSNWIIAHVKLTLEFVDDSGNSKFVTREGWGGQAIKMSKSTGSPNDLGDEYKGAHSDAFKKAAQKFGIGLDLARKEEAIAYDEVERIENAPKATEATLQTIRAAIEGMTDEQKAATKLFFVNHNIRPLNSGMVTEDQGEELLSFVATL